MRYSDELIDEVVRRTDIVALIGENVRLKRAGKDYVGLCPFHSEKTPSFSVSPGKQMYYCFGCHAGGGAITYMMEYHNYSFTEALGALAERAGMTLPEESLTQEQRAASERKNRFLDMYKKAAGFYYYRLKADPQGAAMRYLRNRGLTEETIRRFGLGYAEKSGSLLYQYLKQQSFDDSLLMESGLFRFDERHGASDLFWNRVMFPILDARGRVIAFGGRVMGDGKPKYLNSPETSLFNKSRNLYALHYARSSRKGSLILCEGYMDVIAMHQAGFDNACASLGTALTPEQARLISRFTDRVYLMYDSDGAGVQAALRAIPILKDAGLTPKVVNLRPCKDPDEFIRAEGAEALEERLRDAENAFLFEIRQIAGDYSRSDPASWTAFQHKAAEKLLTFSEELERENYLEAVCGIYGIDLRAMKKLLGDVAARGTPAEHYQLPKSTRVKPEREDSFVRTQRLMLNYLASYAESYPQTKDMIGPADFTDPFCRRIADALYPQLEEGSVYEAGILAGFADPEEQRRAAELFHFVIPVESDRELDRAFTDTVLRMLSGRNEERARSEDIGDAEVFRLYIDTEKKIEQFRNGRMLHLPYEGERNG